MVGEEQQMMLDLVAAGSGEEAVVVSGKRWKLNKKQPSVVLITMVLNVKASMF